MIKTFLLESDSQPNPEQPDICARLKVSVRIKCRESDLSDATWELDGIENLNTGRNVEFNSLMPHEKKTIQVLANEYVHEYKADAYDGFLEWLAERRSDDEP